ncbi:MAG: peptidase U62 [Myxococcales bacterium FL481]|nr:MAG: peptidase U62 [Myxococcales bacterium FL481]
MPSHRWSGVLGLLLCTCASSGRLASRHEPGTPLHAERAEAPVGAAPSPLVELLETELDRNLARLQGDDLETPAYFLAYDVIDSSNLWLEAHHGALVADHINQQRQLDIDVRVGNHQLDNSHNQQGDYVANGLGSGMSISLDHDPLSLAQSLWLQTEIQFRDAEEAYREAENHEQLVTHEGSPVHPDFSQEPPLVHLEPAAELDVENLGQRWRPIVERVSAELGSHRDVLYASAMLEAEVQNHTLVNTEGSRVQSGRTRLRVILSVTAQADDGMQVERFATFDGHRPDQLPREAELQAAAGRLVDEVLALRVAPVAEPYTGPAVLEGHAAGVFFHEIFGHRLEGHRQKQDFEGQTFTKMLNQPVLPRFLSVIDDPTISTLGGQALSGHYFVDDEAVPAKAARLVDNGKLRGFLLARSPVLPFRRSNGHGRREVGHPVVARQGNLIVQSRRTIPEAKLRDALVAEAKRQNKPYGLWFRDIQGGVTLTDRQNPQAFKVMPLIVYRVWTDGRPDELVRGVDIVGTPLAAFETILRTGDRLGVFNGLCYAESGWIPVSAVSPSLLLSKLEIERAVHDRDRPPLLAPPALQASWGRTSASPMRRRP